MYKSSTIESAARYTTAAALYAAIQCAMQDAPEEADDSRDGPARSAMIVFAYLLSGAAGSYKVNNTRPRLAALLETVRKNWALFGGGAKPAELAPVRKARAVWPAALVKLWREQIECREYSDALRIGQEQLGALCFAVTGKQAFMVVAPQQVEGLPAELVSVRRDDGKYTVTDTISGCAMGNRGHATRSGAEGEALALWERTSEEKRAAVLANGRAVQTNKSGADAFAQWAAEHGIDSAIIEQAETAAAEQAETVTDAPQTAEQLRAEFVARGFDVVQVETVREVAPAADVLAISADVAIAADTLARLTSQAAHCADRRAAIESGIRGHVSALAYIVPALQRLQDFGRGLEKSEAARALRELAGAGLMAAPAVVEQTAPAADVAPAVYTLPDGGRTYEDWAGSACRGYVPTARQQIVIDAVKSALTAGLFYTSDVFAHCVAVLSPSEEQLSIGRGRVENGEVGMDCYYARRAIDAQELHASEDAALSEMRLSVGDSLGLLVFSDYKQSRACTVLELDGLSVKIGCARGARKYTMTAGILAVKSAIERAASRGSRPDDYPAFCAGRPAASPAIVAPMAPQPIEQPAPVAQPEQVEQVAPPACAYVSQPAEQIGAAVPTDADSGRGIRWHKACADAIRGRREFWTLAGRAVYRAWDGRMGALQLTARPPAVRAAGQGLARAGRGAVNPGRFAQPGAVPMRKTRPAVRISGQARARIDRRSFAGAGFSP